MNEIIFVLEDMMERMSTFKKIAIDIKMELIHCSTVEHAKNIYLISNPSVVFLDHDLGQEIFVNSNEENTGYQFAKWMVKNDKDYKQRTIIIHSANPVGAENINNVLGGFANIIPITSFVRNQDILYDNRLLTKMTP